MIGQEISKFNVHPEGLLKIIFFPRSMMQEHPVHNLLIDESTFHVITSRRIGFAVIQIGLVLFCNKWQFSIILLEPYEKFFKDRYLLIGFILLGLQIQPSRI